MHYKDLPANTVLASFDALTDIAKKKAVSEFLAFETRYHSRKIEKVKSQSLHTKINDKNHIRKLLENAKRISRLKTDLPHCENVIKGNLLQFLTDGTYITYIN